MAGVEFGMLGPLRVTSATRHMPITSARERALLAVLIINAGRLVSIPNLIDAVWGDDPPRSARNLVHTYIWRLRCLLWNTCTEEAQITACSSGYLLRAAPEQVDAWQFEQLYEKGRRAAVSDPARAAQALRSALGMWRGDALQDVTLHGGYETEAQRLAELRVTAVEHRIDADLALGEHERLVGELQVLTSQYPLRERLVGQLMLALSRSGRQSDALAAFDRLRRQLGDELGIDPGPALCQLHESILRGGVGTRLTASAIGLAPTDIELAPTDHAEPGRVGPPSVPRQLPRDLCQWVGRARELRDLTGLLDAFQVDAPVAIPAIDGTAGIGKTALAVHWAHSVAHRFPDGQLYLDLRGQSPARSLDPHEAVARLLRSLGIADDRIPADTEAAAALFRSVVAGQKVLILLDDAASAAQVGPLLPGSPRSLVIITSRAWLRDLAVLHDVRRITMRPFSPEDSLTLLAAILTPERVAAAGAAAAALADMCGHLPRTLRIAAANLADRPESHPRAWLEDALRPWHEQLEQHFARLPSTAPSESMRRCRP